MSSCRKFLNVYSLRRPTLSTRTALPLALVLRHLILDVLTHLRRRTSPTHPYPTVTYGNSINVLELHNDDNSPCYVKHHSPCATSRSRMVNGMNFTTSPPSTSRCH